VQLAALRRCSRRKALVRTLNVLHAVRDLRLGEMLLLASHQILFLLLSTLEGILLVGSKSGAEGREAGRERRLRATSRGCGSRRCSSSPWSRWRCGSLTMRNSDLRDEERLSRVSDPADKLCEGLVVCILGLLDKQFRREEASLVPVVHLKTRPRALSLALRVAVDPAHPVRHNHSTLLWRRRLV
jgi:hypothetical protein